MIQDFLGTVEMFRELDTDDLAHLLMVGLVKRYAPEVEILTEGTIGGRLNVIHQGQVRISKVVPGAGEEALVILGPGEIFGEVEFFDGSPSSAHAIAHTDCEILSIPHEEIRGLMSSRPELTAKFLWALGRTLARRIRSDNQRMASLFAISRDF